ncbi:ABC transporter permease [Jiangella alba]|uniref:Peptide/nickel transport system permease protein n=1 Tax=Jiangella alba TaxID=561176 RepID=A0A1H5MG23_9ACTN|nr:ABC transporter permease [Jiangella alba]SEE88286.1 peptide/nickel transport system permease protein [Jiangella alba]
MNAQPVATVTASAATAKPIEGRGTWALAWSRLRHDRVAMISLVVILLIVVVAIAAPLVAHVTGHPPNEQYRDIGLSPEGLPRAPNSTFWLGTDDLGRDILVRIAYGARVSLLVGVVATGLTVVIGVLVGLAAGYVGGWLDTVLARIVDVVLSVPFLLVAIALVSVTGPSMTVTVLVIGFFSWASVARIVRGQVLSIREREYVEAARSLGAGSIRIMFVDVLPNVLAPVIVYTTLLVPVVIVTQATLSFLGLGLPPPTADWGGMISSAQNYYTTAWWFVVFPGAALLITTLAFNLFGDGVRDAFDPRFSQQLRR